MKSNFEISKSLKIISNELKKLKENGIIRSKNLVGDLGEYYASKVFSLTIEPNRVNAGYDAIDAQAQKVEIKARVKPEPQNKIIFGLINFDYCYFVELDEFFEPFIIRKALVNEIKDNLENTRQRMSVSRFRLISKVVWIKPN